MRFALLGDHPDGLGMALALSQSGRHALLTYSGPPAGLDLLRQQGGMPKPVGDIEEILADPAVETVIVAGKRANRPAQLRRALQSERHVLCVHPADERPDIGYEAALLQNDARVVLLPLLAEGLHPGVVRLAALAGRVPDSAKSGRAGVLGVIQLVEVERWSVTRAKASPVPLATLPGWEVLRAVGGDLAEVLAFTGAEELTNTEPILLSGRFLQGGLLRVLFLPEQAEPRIRVAVLGSHGRAELVLDQGWSGPARLSWRDETGTTHEEGWDSWNPWPKMVEVFETAIQSPLAPDLRGPTWQDALRALELDDAVRRSVRYRRVSTLEYPEATEEVGFKGTMTLVGCGMLWVILLLLIVSSWAPGLRWLIVPALVFFLGLQLLRWVIPEKEQRSDSV